MAFQLTKASRYQHVPAKDSEVSGRPLPLRVGDGHLALSVEDRVFLEEALLERSRVISGGDSDDATWSGSPEGFPVAWHVSGSIALDGGISAVYDSLKGMCGRVVMLSGSYGGTSDTVYGGEYTTTGVPDSALAYLDSEIMTGRVFSVLKAVPNSTLEGTLHFHGDTTPTGFPGDPVTNAESLTGGTSGVMAALQAARLFDSLVKTVQDGLAESEGTRSLSVRRYAAAACDAARMDRLLVPADVEDGNCRGTLSVTGVTSIKDAYPDRKDIWYRKWPTSRSYTVRFSTYADCLSTRSSRSFFPFLCWCLCPFWYDTYLWDPESPSKPFKTDDRHGSMTSGNTYSPTIYFKWKAAKQTGTKDRYGSSACCPTDASVSGMTGSSVLSVSLKSIPEPKSEKAVVVYRAWRSIAQSGGDVSYRSAFAVGVWDVSGGDRVNLPSSAVSSSTAKSILSRCKIRTDDMQGYEPEHSRQYGVDVVCAYLVVRPGFRSDISDNVTELRRLASR